MHGTQPDYFVRIPDTDYDFYGTISNFEPTKNMLIDILALLLGLVVLVFAADWFVDGASAIARNFGISPLLIGLTIVGLGTSAPEIMVSSLASFQGNPGLAIGNAIGSNIANMGLILGVTALLAPSFPFASTQKRVAGFDVNQHRLLCSGFGWLKCVRWCANATGSGCLFILADTDSDGRA